MTSLKKMMDNGEFVVTCEFVPGRGKAGPALDAAVQFAREVRQAGATIHAVSLTDNPGGAPAVLPDVIAAEVQKEGIEALVHFSCRDLNRNAMESRAMALARNGIRNLLVVTGDYATSGYEGQAAGVFDLDAVQAVRYLKAMNAGLEIPGRKPGTTERLAATDFFIGVGVSPFKFTEAELMMQFFKLERKIAAGADFVITQLGYDMRKALEVRRYLASRGLKTPVIGNVYVLSAAAGRTMAAGKVPGCVVTAELAKVLEAESKAEDKGKAARFERAAKMMAVLKGSGFNGVHIGGFGLKPQDIFHIVKRAGELGDRWESFIPELSFGRRNEYYAFPPPERYVLDAPDPDPWPRLGSAAKPFPYRMASLSHRLMFEPDAAVYKIMRAYFRAIPDKGILYRLTHGFEKIVKRLLFDCRDCGDCALPDMAYCCPMAKCAKKQRNGPCGGSLDGMCEVYPDDRRCVWTMVYERLKSSGDLEPHLPLYVPPRNAQLEDTAGWANFYLGRDHSRQPKTKEKS